jgi:hypothetical protein
VGAQFSQAVTSLLFALLGLRVLSAADFAVLGLLLGGLVLSTAVMTGFVGDSLTVLDRRDPRVRGALQWSALVLSLGLLAAATGVTAASGLLGAGTALLFGCGVAAFTLEDIGRRLLMANLRFWSVVAVDLVYALVAGAVLGLSARGPGALGLEDFLAALLAGQVLALVSAVLLLPKDERRWAQWRGAALGEVFSFGAWRAAHQAVRPGALTLVRSIVLASTGAATLAAFEASRVYVSPALLLMQGSGSFLLATNAQERGRSSLDAVRAADRAAALLAAAGLLLGLLLVVLLPWLGPVLTGGNIPLTSASVASWSAVAVASGLAMPYGSLATVRARPRRLMAVRLTDTAVSLTVVLVLVAVPAETGPFLPLALALGILTAAVLQRRIVSSERGSTGEAAVSGGR